MRRRPIPPKKLVLPVYDSWKTRWFLLTSGDLELGRYNTMTVAWGGLGNMWDRPTAFIVVRPTRYTYQFTEAFRDFTLSLFPEEFEEKLMYCGSHSGRDVDKVKESGLTPLPSQKVAAPAFDQAELILECRTMYFDDLAPEHFLADHIIGNYPARDFHRMYLGEILAVHGTQAYEA